MRTLCLRSTLGAALLILAGSASAGHIVLSPAAKATVLGTAQQRPVGILLRFDLSAIEDSSANVDWAGLTLRSVLDSSIQGRPVLQVRAIASDWSASVNYDALSLSRVQMPPVSMSYDLDSNRVTLDVTQMVALWRSDSLANNGVVVTVYQNQNESISLTLGRPIWEAQLEVYYSR